LPALAFVCLTARLHQGDGRGAFRRNPSAVRPDYAGFFVKAYRKRRRTSSKKNPFMQPTPTNQISRLQSRTALSVKEAEKFIIVAIESHEQVVTFSPAIKHVDAFDAVKRQYPAAKAISAGFYLFDDGALWTGGMSDTLGLNSRKADNALVMEFIKNPDPQFILMAGGAQ
jgi:hypothetical protein